MILVTGRDIWYLEITPTLTDLTPFIEIDAGGGPFPLAYTLRLHYDGQPE